MLLGSTNTMARVCILSAAVSRSRSEHKHRILRCNCTSLPILRGHHSCISWIMQMFIDSHVDHQNAKGYWQEDEEFQRPQRKIQSAAWSAVLKAWVIVSHSHLRWHSELTARFFMKYKKELITLRYDLPPRRIPLDKKDMAGGHQSHTLNRIGTSTAQRRTASRDKWEWQWRLLMKSIKPIKSKVL